MAVPTTNIKFNSIWLEANNTNLTASSNINAQSLFGKSYFDGPNGSSTISFNGWGVQTGDNIFGTTISDLSWGNFSGLVYWYDNSTYVMDYEVTNNGLNSSDDFDVQIFLTDNTSQIYTWADTNQFNAAPGTSTGVNTFSVSGFGGTPLLDTNFYNITFISNRSYPGGGTFDVYINGAYVGSQSLPTTSQTFDCSALGGPQNVAFNGGNGFSIFIDMYP